MWFHCGLIISLCVQFNPSCAMLIWSAVVVKPVFFFFFPVCKGAQPNPKTHKRWEVLSDSETAPLKLPLLSWVTYIAANVVLGQRNTDRTHTSITPSWTCIKISENDCSHLVQFVETFDSQRDRTTQISDAAMDPSADLQPLLYSRSWLV